MTDAIAKKINNGENDWNQVILGTRRPGEEIPRGKTETLAGTYSVRKLDLEKGEQTAREKKAGISKRWFLDIELNEDAASQNAEGSVEAWLLFGVSGKDLDRDDEGCGEVVFAERAADGEVLKSAYQCVESLEESAPETTAETGTAAEAPGAGEAKVYYSEEDGAELPAQTFRESTKYMSVIVEAEEGTFPAGTTMIMTDVAETEIEDAIQAAGTNPADVTKISASESMYYSHGNTVNEADTGAPTQNENDISKACSKLPLSHYGLDSYYSALLAAIKSGNSYDSGNIAYTAYGHTSGNFRIKAEKTIDANAKDAVGKAPAEHMTDVSGTLVETYKIVVTYEPSTNDAYDAYEHTTTGGKAGKITDPRNEEDKVKSENIHKINVIKKV